MKIIAERNGKELKYPTLNEYKKINKEIFMTAIISLGIAFNSCNRYSADSVKGITETKKVEKAENVEKKYENEIVKTGGIGGGKGGFKNGSDEWTVEFSNEIRKNKISDFIGRKGERRVPRMIIGEGVVEDIPCDENGSDIPAYNKKFYMKLAKEAEKRTKLNIIYNPAYFRIKYPMGDIPEKYGVCTDVIIRSYRAMGIDLQQKIHIDMKRNFSLYPKLWKLSKPDSNIDHRRVPNLMVFFKRFGISLPINKNPKLYLPGDIVTWNLEGAITHIGIVSDKISKKTGNPLIVHNIGGGPVLQDMLFDYKITGHFRYGR